MSIDTPYRIAVAYGDDHGSPYANSSAKLDSQAISALALWRFDNGLSLQGGLRHVSVSGEFRLAGLDYHFLSGYTLDLPQSTGTGWIAGAAYEQPAGRLRVALTHENAVDIDLTTVERQWGGRQTETGTILTLP